MEFLIFIIAVTAYIGVVLFLGASLISFVRYLMGYPESMTDALLITWMVGLIIMAVALFAGISLHIFGCWDHNSLSI